MRLENRCDTEKNFGKAMALILTIIGRFVFQVVTLDKGLLFVAFAVLANYLMVMMFTNNPSSIRDGTDRQTNCETNYWFIISTAAGSALILFLSLVPCQTRGYEYRTATTGQKSTESLF